MGLLAISYGTFGPASVLAALAALLAMMLVATPAIAQPVGPAQCPETNPAFVFADPFDVCIKPGACPSFVQGRESRQRLLDPALAAFVPGNNDANGKVCIVDVDGVVKPPDRDKDRDRDRFDVFDDIGNVSFEIGDVENESGDIELENNFSVEGNNNNVCVGQQQFGNTGNFTNQQGVLQSGGVFIDDNDRDHDWNWWNRDRDHNWNWWHHDDNDWWDDDDRDRVFFGGAEADDIEFNGPDVTFAPENETTCDQSVEQAAAASSTWGW